MGRYLDLARQTIEETLGALPSTSTNSKNDNTASYASQEAEPVPLIVDGSEKSAISERTSELRSSLAGERCIHKLPPDKCAVCSGYVRWLIAGGEPRLAEACRNPKVARHRYWRLRDGGLTEEPRERGNVEGGVDGGEGVGS